MEQEGFGTLRCQCGRARIEQRSTGALHLIVQIPLQHKNKTSPKGEVLFLWRSRRDLNPRYPFGVHTISSRARYDHFDTAPWVRHSCRLAYDTTTALICQVVFLLFSFIFANRVRGVILRGFSLKNARRNVEGSLIIYPSVEIRGVRIWFFKSLNRNKKWETTKVVSHFWSECRDSNSRPLEPHFYEWCFR